MRLHVLWISFALSLVACSGDVSDDATSSSGGDANPFIGVYDGTYSGTSTTTSPPMPTKMDTNTGVITVEAGTTTDLKMTIALTGTGQTTCAATMDSNGNTAAFSPPQQGCDLTLAGGAQTNSNSGDATWSGDVLTIHVHGSFTGTSNGSPYSGNYDGTWTATRR